MNSFRILVGARDYCCVLVVKNRYRYFVYCFTDLFGGDMQCAISIANQGDASTFYDHIDIVRSTAYSSSVET